MAHQQLGIDAASKANRHTSRPTSDESLRDHYCPGAPQEPSRPNNTQMLVAFYEPCLPEKPAFGQRARAHDCPGSEKNKRKSTTMGNGASCGENARDVGVDEELNPMIMGDADKENNYRRPSVPHVQAVRVQCPLEPPRILSAAAARP